MRKEKLQKHVDYFLSTTQLHCTEDQAWPNFVSASDGNPEALEGREDMSCPALSRTKQMFKKNN